jgi:hypothetical protein
VSQFWIIICCDFGMMATSVVVATAVVGDGSSENDSLMQQEEGAAPTDNVSETDSQFARRLAEEELVELRQQHQRTEENDYAIATAVRGVSWEAYRNDRRIHEPYYQSGSANAPYYYATNTRPLIIHKPDDTSYYCFCFMFWCFFFWLFAFLLIILLVPTYA